MNKKLIYEEREQLVEEIGLYFEFYDTLPPLSARILAYLSLSTIEGICFDQLQEDLKASKSSISTNLKLLQSKGRIDYFTKPGDRKRYFRIDHAQLINRLDHKIAAWENERLLQHKIFEFKKRDAYQRDERHLSSCIIKNNKHYIIFLESMIDNLKQLRNNLKSRQ